MSEPIWRTYARKHPDAEAKCRERVAVCFRKRSTAARKRAVLAVVVEATKMRSLAKACLLASVLLKRMGKYRIGLTRGWLMFTPEWKTFTKRIFKGGVL